MRILIGSDSVCLALQNLAPVSKTQVCSHGGAITQFNNLLVRRIEARILIVIFSNVYGTRLGNMSRGINTLLHGKRRW
jgi:hypothetical protein